LYSQECVGVGQGDYMKGNQFLKQWLAYFWEPLSKSNEMDQRQCNSLHKPLKALFATSKSPNYMDGLQPKTKKWGHLITCTSTKSMKILQMRNGNDAQSQCHFKTMP
jgi:hypothetical protein